MSMQHAMTMNRKQAQTGVVKFTNDWPGIFIRGDYAGPFADAIAVFLGRETDNESMQIAYAKMTQLLHLLRSCKVESKNE